MNLILSVPVLTMTTTTTMSSIAIIRRRIMVMIMMTIILREGRRNMIKIYFFNRALFSLVS